MNISSSSLGYNPVYGEAAPEIEHVRDRGGYAILEFGAPWCGHCKAAQSLVQEVVSEHAELLHIKVYDGKGKPLGRAFRVKLWPTLILLKNGEEVARLVRPTSTHQVRELLVSVNNNFSLDS